MPTATPTPEPTPLYGKIAVVQMSVSLEGYTSKTFKEEERAAFLSGIAAAALVWTTEHMCMCRVYRYSPCHSPQSVPLLAMSFTTECTVSRHVIHHIVSWCSPRHPPHSFLVLATSATT
jgi:hypothetical protein